MRGDKSALANARETKRGHEPEEVHVDKSLYLRSLKEKAAAGQLKSAAVDISESELLYLGQKFVA
jgi:hypothetical protein